MTRTVYLTISGIQSDEIGEEFVSEGSGVGEYFKRDDGFWILYEEEDPDTKEITKNTLKIKDRTVTLIRHGAIRTRMEFVEGAIIPAEYITPYGTLHLQIHTKDVKILFSETEGEIRLNYTLYSEGQLLSRCELSILCQAQRDD